MSRFTRRSVLAGGGAFLAAGPPAGCVESGAAADVGRALADARGAGAARHLRRHQHGRFPVAAVDTAAIPPRFLRTRVAYASSEAPGTIVIDPADHFLYLVRGAATANRYGVGVGREGFGWSGVATINSKQEWPDWYPPKEMIERQPEPAQGWRNCRAASACPAGPRNPLGARAMYLWQGNKDTLFRIHGTLEPRRSGPTSPPAAFG